jgi:hypothetical protein
MPAIAKANIPCSDRRNIVICATSIISGNRMMDAAIEKEAFARKETTLPSSP